MARTSRRTSGGARRRLGRKTLGLVAAVGMLGSIMSAAAVAQDADPRVGLAPGLWDAADAIEGLEHLAWFQKRDGQLQGTVSDLAFQDDYIFMGNYSGLQIFDASDPSDPQLITEVVCPGSQNDISVFGDLAFQSVEATGGRIDCLSGGVNAQNRMRGVRVWDISDVTAPELVKNVQLCRGSHTHSLVEDPNDDSVVYIYNSGTASQRSSAEVVSTPDGETTGRCGASTSTSPIFDNRSNYMTEVIRVPLDAPEDAQVVTEARLFQDFETGAINGLQNSAPPGGHPCSRDEDPDFFCSPAGANYSPNPNTNTCHDITAYPDIGLAAGACQGNGVLIDISDPANPSRIDAVADENFAYWHSATFNNDGTTVLFTDEWGGGGGARCMPNHREAWGANALYDIVDTPQGKRMEFASYYKLPAPQTAQENCVAHNGSLIPVPGRDLMVQAWYQGGISIFDFTDAANPHEIGFFDRGPISTGTNLISGGYWSAYWYDGNIYGSEIARGLDVFALADTDELSVNEIAVAEEVDFQQRNVQGQERFTFEPTPNLARAYNDQALRGGTLDRATWEKVDRFVTRAERFEAGPQRRAAVATLSGLLNDLERRDGVDDLVATIRSLLAQYA
jgi:hypothetical protein